MPKQYCSYCLPTKRRHHFPFHLEYLAEKTIGSVAGLLKRATQTIPRSATSRVNSLWGLFLEFLSLLKIVNFTPTPDETKLPNLALIFFREAKKKGIEIKAAKFLGRQMNEFKFCHQGKRYYFESVPLAMQGPKFEVDNKYKVKRLLQKHGIPVPKGKIFVSPAKAIRFAQEIGYPLVVKPVSGSLSWHVVCPVNTVEDLEGAIKIVKKYRPDFLVEEYVEGELHRATVVGQKHLFICKKEKANVVGDGFSTVQQLIEKKNADERRGKNSQKNTTLYQIAIDDFLKENLTKRGLNFNSVLQEGEKLCLQDKLILACGCDIINLTDETHIENKELFLRIARLLGANLVGIDVICSDIAKPYTEQKFAVLESNSLPHLDMHQVPSHGKPDKVAEVVWDVLLEKLNERSRVEES